MLNVRKTRHSDEVFLNKRRNIILESVDSVSFYPLIHLSQKQIYRLILNAFNYNFI